MRNRFIQDAGNPQIYKGGGPGTPKRANTSTITIAGRRQRDVRYINLANMEPCKVLERFYVRCLVPYIEETTGPLSNFHYPAMLTELPAIKLRSPAKDLDSSLPSYFDFIYTLLYLKLASLAQLPIFVHTRKVKRGYAALGKCDAARPFQTWKEQIPCLERQRRSYEYSYG